MQAFVYGERRPLPDGFEGFVDPARTAVVSIDMHQGHLADTPDCPARRRAPGKSSAPIDRFQPGRAPAACRWSMCEACCGAAASTMSTACRRRGARSFRCMSGPIPNADEHAIEGTRWNAFETEVLPDDLIVQTKKRLTAFYPSDLDFLLRNMGTRTLVLDGVMADCCVLNTAFDASNLGYDVVVLRDLVRGTNAEMEAAAEKIVSLHLGLVMDAADLLAAWRARSAISSRSRRKACSARAAAFTSIPGGRSGAP